MITIQNLTKSFKIPHQVTRTLFHKLTSALYSPYEYEELYALKDISLTVQKGEFFGIMGRNGCGKTTLLRVIAGIYRPTSGTCRVEAGIAPLLELGLGFQARLTCRDNIFINGALLGFSRGEIQSRYNDIMQFAELAKFADMSLDQLSSGMKVRLAFAIAIQSPAPIFLVDEVLAVGDVLFQEKCKEVFRAFKRQGRTVLFVSHDPDAVEEFCDRVVIMQEGKVVHEGSPNNLEKTVRNLAGFVQPQTTGMK